MTLPRTPAFYPLKGVRILSLALNLPGPAALMRCRDMGARCVKLEPPSGDPMQIYCQAAYMALHDGIRIITADLKTEAGQHALHRELTKTDVLLTSFRPSALSKLGLSWQVLHKLYPQLSQVAVVGSPGLEAEAPGHDLTYLAECGLVIGLDLPATLYADMGGSLLASHAVLQTVMHQILKGKGIAIEVALSSAANYLALPRSWGLTQPGEAVGGGHAGYQVYQCKNGRVAVAALEPHFAERLCAAAGLQSNAAQNHTGQKPSKTMHAATTRQAIAAWLLSQTRSQLDKLARDKDIPLHTMG